MLKLYMTLMRAASPLLRRTLVRRCVRGKEDPMRLGERMGIPARARPAGKLVWIHAASVGEAQSMLSLADALLRRTPASILMTTGTVTSARLMAQRLPARAIHQYYPLDNPAWTASFLDHWQPDLALWTEFELWPAMLAGLRRRGIPAVLLNAALSDKSWNAWRRAPGLAKKILSCFGLIVAETEEDSSRLRALGAAQVVTGGNLKYSAAPLPVVTRELNRLQARTAGRPLWLYASTHEGEEGLACRLHAALKKDLPGLLTVIAPRHPERGGAIDMLCRPHGLTVRRRTEALDLPEAGDDIYIADTLGELGLFYRLSPLACIGRSFSDDGGGGHNPLEAAQLGCAVLHGPHIQNLAAIFEGMDRAGAALCLKDETDFQTQLRALLTSDTALAALRQNGLRYAGEKSRILDTVLDLLQPWLARAGIPAAANGDASACA